MRICWLEARGYWNVDQVWPRDPQPCYETSCIMQMKGTHAPPPENWDTRQTLLRELVPSQSRSASPLPFLIRTSSFFHLASPQGDRWNLKKKVAFHDPPSSAEKSRMKNQGKKKEREMISISGKDDSRADDNVDFELLIRAKAARRREGKKT